MMKFLLILLGCSLFCNHSYADDLNAAAKVSIDGLKVQSKRIKMIAQNIANANIPPSKPNKVPYRRKVATVKSVTDNQLELTTVQSDTIAEDNSPFILKYEPHHPAANEKGYVQYPNINILIEYADAKQAQLNLEANLRAFEITKNMQMQIVHALK